jgi:hypothetical protein
MHITFSKFFNLNNIFIGFFCLFTVFFFLPKGSFIVWMSLLSLSLITIYEVKFIKSNIIDNALFKNKFFILLSLLFFIQFLSCFFAYDIKDSLNQLHKDYLQVIIFGIIILINYKIIKFLTVYKIMTITLFLLVVYYFYEISLYNNSYNFFNSKFITPRDSTFLIPILLPFALYGLIFYFNKNKFYTFIATLSIFFSIILIFFSASRGAFLVFGSELIIFIIYVLIQFFKMKKYKYILYILFIFISLLVGLFFIVNITNNKLLEQAINKGLFNSTGRDVILKSLEKPLMDNLLIGKGLGQKNSEILINKYHIGHEYVHINLQGRKEMGSHNSYIQFIRESGIFALIIYISLIILLLKTLFSFDKKITSVHNMFSLIFITVIIDHYVFRGLVESLDFGKFYFIVFLFIALYYNLKEEQISK